MITFKTPKILDCYGPGGSAGGDAGTGSSAGMGGAGEGGAGTGTGGLPAGADPSSSGDPTSGGFGGTIAGGGLGLGDPSSTGDLATDKAIDQALAEAFGDVDALSAALQGDLSQMISIDSETEQALVDAITNAEFSVDIGQTITTVLGNLSTGLVLGGMLTGITPAVSLGMMSKAVSTVIGKAMSLGSNPTPTPTASTVAQAQPLSGDTQSQTSDQAQIGSKDLFKAKHSPKSLNYQNIYSGSVNPQDNQPPDLVGMDTQNSEWLKRVSKIKSYLKEPTFKELYS